jgi:thioredoxin-like negative regulator of GroEL
LRLGAFYDKIESMENWKPTTEAVNTDSFQKVTAANQIVVIHFWADWNLIDRKMDSVLANLRPKFAGQIGFYAFDTTPEENWDICRQCNILNLPALVCFINGQLHETLIGLRPEEELEAKFAAWQQ